jgi:hypothetical protein
MAIIYIYYVQNLKLMQSEITLLEIRIKANYDLGEVDIESKNHQLTIYLGNIMLMLLS